MNIKIRAYIKALSCFHALFSYIVHNNTTPHYLGDLEGYEIKIKKKKIKSANSKLIFAYAKV